MNIIIDLNAEPPSITGDRQALLTVLEAARRDMNAMSLALGASADLRAHYSRLAAEFAVVTAGVPRINPMSATPVETARPVSAAPAALDPDLEDLLS